MRLTKLFVVAALTMSCTNAEELNSDSPVNVSEEVLNNMGEYTDEDKALAKQEDELLAEQAKLNKKWEELRKHEV